MCDSLVGCMAFLIRTFLANGMKSDFNGEQHQDPTELLDWLIHNILAEMADEAFRLLDASEKGEYDKHLIKAQQELALKHTREWLVANTDFIKGDFPEQMDPFVVKNLFESLASPEEMRSSTND